MRLTRVYIEGPLQPGQRRPLTGSAVNHVTRVLRLRSGDALTVFDGSGGEFPATIEDVRRDTASVLLGAHDSVERESSLRLTLIQGISRGERMDWVVQKATELGVNTIVPLFTERSVVQLDAQQASKKLQHWRSVAIGACEQSGRNRLPIIAQPVPLAQYFEQLGAATEVRLLLSPRANQRLTALESVARGALVMIGPEGGLSDNEQAAAQAHEFTPVRLGPRVLRTETAAIVALSLLQQQWGDL